MIDGTEKLKIRSKHTRALLAQVKGESFFAFKRPLLKVDLAGRVPRLPGHLFSLNRLKKTLS